MYDRRLPFLFLLGAISLAASACGGGSRSGQTPCEITSDCGSGFVCTAGVCEARSGSSSTGTSCRTQLDCEAGEVCQGGFCNSGSSGGLSCTNIDDCPGGQYCQFGTQRCVQCLTNAQCPRGEVCLGNGTCGTSSSGGGGGGTVGGTCSSSIDCNGQVCVRGQCLPCAVDTDCRQGESCRGNQCVVTDGGSPFCENQRDCDPYGNICNTISGRCEPCANSGQCGVGRTCTNGVCRRNSSGGGGGNGNVGAECDSRSDCSNNYACWIGSCSPCYFDDMCSDLADIFTGPKICDVQTGQCGPAECVNAGDCAPGEGCWGNGHCGQCTTDSTCRPGEVCNEGVCETPGSSSCASNADCSNGQVCSGGSCSACVASGQCGPGFICTDGACAPDAGGGTPPGGGTGSTPLGNACNPTAPSCEDGTFCVTVGGVSKCTRACVGSGRGGDEDCPTGMACYDFASGAFDGAKFCVGTDQLAQTTPGSPFTTAPGGACSAINNSCQTSFCQNGGVCARACMANRDCNGGEVCFAVVDGNNVSSGYHACVASDTTTYLPAGAACTSNLECDSGVCTGFCSNNGNPCDDSGDCGLGGTCNGTCANHCRTSSDCESNETCLPWATDRNGSENRDWTPVCRPGTGGSTANGEACTSDGECASWWCVSGICTEPCGSNADCTGALASQSCGPVTFTDAGGAPVYSMSFCVY